MAGIAAVKFWCRLFIRAGECDDDPAGRTGIFPRGKFGLKFYIRKAAGSLIRPSLKSLQRRLRMILSVKVK